jgi:hypothetical protein
MEIQIKVLIYEMMVVEEDMEALQRWVVVEMD